MSSTYKQSTLLTKFHDRIAGSIAGLETCPRIAFFRFGHGYLDESTTPPTILPVPSDLAEIPEVFFSGVPEMVKADGRVLVRCFMPKDSLTEAKQYSMTGLYDQDGNLLAVMQDLPGWLTADYEHTSYGYLDFAHVGANPPTAF